MMDHVNGIDVSDAGQHGDLDWGRVHNAGYSFAYAKASEGTYYHDRTFPENVNGIRQSTMLAGAYHMLSWTDDPAKQAAFFLNAYTPVKGDLPPMVDVELSCPLSPGAAINLLATFNKAVEEKLGGSRIVIYTYPSFWEVQLNRTDAFSGHPLWLAAPYGSAPPSLGNWKPCIWQKSNNRRVDGAPYSGVDWDWWMGTSDTLKDFTLHL